MKNTLCLWIVGLALMPGLVHAQWGWTDQGGRKIFSDRAPAADVPEKQIFKRPPGQSPKLLLQTADTAAHSASTPHDDSPSKAGSSQMGAGVDPILAARQKTEALALEAKRKAEEDKLKQIKNSNCQRIVQAQKNLSSGVRIARTNAQGEREILDDAARSIEAKRLEGLATSECQ